MVGPSLLPVFTGRPAWLSPVPTCAPPRRVPVPFIGLLLVLFLLLPSAVLAAQWRAAPEPSSAGLRHAPPPVPEGWVELRGLYVTVAGDPADYTTVERVLDHAETSVPRLARQMGVPAGPRITIRIAHTREQFRNLQPGTPPSWADATAWPHAGLIFLRAPRLRKGTAQPLTKVLDHEFTHVILGHAFGAREVPHWLQEGLAQYMAREYTPQLTRRMAQGVLGSSLSSLQELTSGFPQDPLRAQLAYAQSADLVAWLRNTYGEDSLRVIIRMLSRGEPVGAAFRAATGTSLEQVDHAWRSRLEQSPFWLSSVVGDSFWWVIGAVLIVVGGVLVRRRNRVRLARWEREEALRESLYQVTLDMHASREEGDRYAWDDERGRWGWESAGTGPEVSFSDRSTRYRVH